MQTAMELCNINAMGIGRAMDLLKCPTGLSTLAPTNIQIATKEPKMNDFETTKQVSPLTNSELGREALKPIKEMIDRQEPLPPEMAKILYDNLWSLYEEAALSIEAQPEVTGAVAEVANDERTNFAYGIFWIKRDVPINTKLYTAEAIEAAVREKLEEALNLAQTIKVPERNGFNQAGLHAWDMAVAEYWKAIRALMESPQPSVEEPAN